jgi:phosphatidylglycerophosphatase A
LTNGRAGYKDVPVCFLISKLNIFLAVICALLFIFFAIWVAAAAGKILKKEDPAEIVIDEIAGLIVTFVGLPFTPKTAIAGFVIFRAFDILKPFPIRTFEEKVAGGPGIVLDDVMAGIYGNIILRLAIYLTDII